MPEQDELANAWAAAQIAVFKQIESQLSALGSANVNAGTRAAAARDLALAYRYAAGGQQPGSVFIESK